MGKLYLFHTKVRDIYGPTVTAGFPGLTDGFPGPLVRDLCSLMFPGHGTLAQDALVPLTD